MSPWLSRTPQWINTPFWDEYYPFQAESQPFLVENTLVDWTAKVVSVSTWTQRTPEWINTPFSSEYYPFQLESVPFIIENDEVDWNARLHPTYIYAEDWTPLLTFTYEIITI